MAQSKHLTSVTFLKITYYLAVTLAEPFSDSVACSGPFTIPYFANQDEFIIIRKGF